jgi:integrase
MWLKEVDPLFIQEQMGHENISTTYEYIKKTSTIGEILLADMLTIA